VRRAGALSDGFDASGALLVADDVGNAVWRVAPVSDRLAATP
jgi:hypothetical protein